MVNHSVALNSSQKTQANVKGAGTLTTVGAAGQVNLYTVPAGKRAVILSYVWQCINVGNGTNIQSVIASFKSRKATAPDSTVIGDPAILQTNGLLLVAGDTVGFIGDAAGNNATVNYFIVIQESAA